MKREKWVLASGSPRRIEMFEAHGLNARVMPADVEETLREGIRAKDAVMFLALKKALYTEKKLLEGKDGEFASLFEDRPPVIVAADTVVAFREEILGKPADLEDAYRMLTEMNGKTHQVYTGVAIVRAGTFEKKVFADCSEVEFMDVPEEEIRAYVDSGEPMDKAGSYAIQGTYGKYVKEFRGSKANIIGFPWERFEEEIKDWK